MPRRLGATFATGGSQTCTVGAVSSACDSSARASSAGVSSPNNSVSASAAGGSLAGRGLELRHSPASVRRLPRPRGQASGASSTSSPENRRWNSGYHWLTLLCPLRKSDKASCQPNSLDAHLPLITVSLLEQGEVCAANEPARGSTPRWIPSHIKLTLCQHIADAPCKTAVQECNTRTAGRRVWRVMRCD